LSFLNLEASYNKDLIMLKNHLDKLWTRVIGVGLVSCNDIDTDSVTANAENPHAVEYSSEN
jgi:hypothetical protein